MDKRIEQERKGMNPAWVLPVKRRSDTAGFTFGSSSQETHLFNRLPDRTVSSFGFGNTTQSKPSFYTTRTASFAATAPHTTGTTVKFQPVLGTDTMIRGGVRTNVGIRHQFITGMREYEDKSFEELRVEDYANDRKGVQAFALATELIGPVSSLPSASTSGFSFDSTTQKKPFFGTTGKIDTFGSSNLFGQPVNQSTVLFGKPIVPGAATTTAPFFNFSSPSTMTSGTYSFDQKKLLKPLLGQSIGATGLSGKTATIQSTAFRTFTFSDTCQPPPLFGQSTYTTGLLGNTATTQHTSFITNASSATYSSSSLLGSSPCVFGNTAINQSADGTNTSSATNSSPSLVGSSTCVFGSTAINQSADGTNTSSATYSPSIQLFNAKPISLVTTNTTTTYSFSSGISGGLFGQKPSTPTLGKSIEFGFGKSGFPCQPEAQDLKLCSDKEAEGGFSTSKDVDVLQQHFKDLLLSGDDHDVIIKIKDREYSAHKSILRARSPVFLAMFKHQMKENDENSISIEDCDAEVFGKFLKYVYTGEVENLTPSDALSLYCMGDKYQISVLKEKCVKFLKSSVSTANVCNIIELATKHSEADLLQCAILFFSEHLEEVLITVDWQRFLADNPIQANELYIKAVKTSYKKNR